jgi:hypothetical protein
MSASTVANSAAGRGSRSASDAPDELSQYQINERKTRKVICGSSTI